MAARTRDEDDKIDDVDDEKANLNPSSKNQQDQLKNVQLSMYPTPSSRNRASQPDLQSAPSLTRRVSSKFFTEIDRRGSMTTFGNEIESAVHNYVPNTIAHHIPGLNRVKSPKLTATYFCNICFTKYPINEGFKLTNCHHMYCNQCLKDFLTNKIKEGIIKPTCFYPPATDPDPDPDLAVPVANAAKPCSIEISENDIKAIVDVDIWNKYMRFKSNLLNNLSRQCPYCNMTTIGDINDPIIICSNNACNKSYCLYHNNAHPMSESCNEYELRTAKETKMNEMAIMEMGDNVKSCPQCNFRILKNGGCNHMNCVKCGCSFCWLCMEVIVDSELPEHYKDDGPCKGKQFEGMEGEMIDPPPKWIVAILTICAIIFCIPATVLGIVFGLLCFPLCCCLCPKNEDGSDKTIFNVMFSCWFLWIIILMAIVIVIPAMVIYCIWIILKAIWDVFRICFPCLPECCTCISDDARTPNNQEFLRVSDIDEDDPNDVDVNRLIGNDIQANQIVQQQDPDIVLNVNDT